MKKGWIIALVALFAVCVALGILFYSDHRNNTEKIEALNADVADKAGQIESLYADVADKAG